MTTPDNSPDVASENAPCENPNTTRRTINAQPTTRYLFAMRDRIKFEWKLVLGELIDNSLDACATRVDLAFNGKNLRVTDNGVGMPDLAAAIQLGNHSGHQEEGSGRFGVGLKDAAIMLWGTTKITSIRNGIQSEIIANWRDRTDHDGWDYEVTETAVDQQSGTTIEFIDFDRHPLYRGPHFNNLIEHLQWMFMHRKPGVEISISTGGSRIVIDRFRAPQRITADTIKETIDINGKQAKLEVGIIRPGQKNKFFGLTYSLAHRSLCSTARGLGECNTNHIFGTVRLSQEWQVSRNKDDMLDKDMEALEQRIEELAAPLIAKAQSQAETVESAAFDRDVQSKIAELLGQAVKERRDKGETHGTAEPKGTERTRTPKKTQHSSSVTRALQGKLRYQWADLDEQEGGAWIIGKFDKGGPRVYLNERVKFLSDARGKNVDLIAFAAIAVMAAYEKEAQTTFNFTGNTMLQIMSEVLGKMSRSETSNTDD